MLTNKEIKACQSVDDLMELGITGLKYEISHRGGYVGYNARCLFGYLGIPERYLELSTGSIGAFCDFLGGGVRGRVTTTDINSEIPERYRRKLEAIVRACERAYWTGENELHLNDLTYEDGETNWEASATLWARRLGVGDKSASGMID